MFEVKLREVCDKIAHHLKARQLDQAEKLLWPALDQFPDMAVLWFFAGNVLTDRARLQPAMQAFRRAAELEANPIVRTNLGALYRRLNRYDDGVRALERALRDDPNNVDALINIGGMYVNEGNPQPGIGYLERACNLLPDADKPRAEWNLALLNLEAGRFDKGFHYYRTGIHTERPARSYAMKAEDDAVLYQPGMPRAGKSLVVWGEQGIGDELMLASILPEAMADFGEVIFECHPRLESLHRRRLPAMRIYPTRKDEYITWPLTDNVRPDYKMPIGDLGALYRPDLQSFLNAWAAGGPYYAADQKEVAEYRARLEALAAGRPIVALAYRGGTFSTSRQYRTLQPADVRALVADTNAIFVSLDYEDVSEVIDSINAELGGLRIVNAAAVSQAYDYEHHGALAAACDMVVTVCQSLAHLSAGMGLNTRVLVPKRCAWRYGLEGERWYWYPSDFVRLIRQDNPHSWDGPLERIVKEING